WEVQFDATWVSGGELQAGTGFSVRRTVEPNAGKTTYTFIAPRGTYGASGYRERLTFGGPVGAVWRLDNISIREILNPPLSQPTTAARPILARMPLTGRRNLLTHTDLQNDWSPISSPDTTISPDAPDGFSKVSFTAPSTDRRFPAQYTVAMTVSAGSSQTLKAKFK